MKTEIIDKLIVLENKIKKIIKSVENDECERNVIVQTSNAKKILLSVKHMILKDYLIKVSGQSHLSKDEILQYFDLMK